MEAERAHKRLPPCRALVVLVSDPVRRLASAYRHSVSREAAAHAPDASPFGARCWHLYCVAGSELAPRLASGNVSLAEFVRWPVAADVRFAHNVQTKMIGGAKVVA